MLRSSLAALLLLAAQMSAAAAADCGKKLELCRGQITVEGLSATLYASLPPREAHPEIRRALVIIHGTDGNAESYFNTGLAATARSGHAADTIVIAPHFAELADAKSAPPGSLVWDRRSNWRFGDLSTSTVTPRVHAFAVLDEILSPLADRALYPSLERVTVAAHSAGAQYLQRYVVASRDIPGLPPVTYIVANPSSMLYLDARRPVPGSTSQFAVPAPSKCETNRYGYGFDQPNAYVKRDSKESEIARYRARRVIYLAGEADTDPNAANLSKTCQAMAQGPMRFARLTAFSHFMDAYYAPHNHRLVTVPGVGHSAGRMFTSPQGLAALFAD